MNKKKINFMKIKRGTSIPALFILPLHNNHCPFMFTFSSTITEYCHVMLLYGNGNGNENSNSNSNSNHNHNRNRSGNQIKQKNS